MTSRTSTASSRLAWIACISAALAAVATYLLWLGWHTPYQQGPDPTVETGPYDAPQVLGLAISLVVLAALLAWWLPPRAAAFGVALGFWVVWSADAATHPNSDGLWPIGSVMLLCGCLIAAFSVSYVVSRLKARRSVDARHVAGSPSK